MSGNITWVVRPGALGDTLLTFPLIKKVKSYSKDDHIVFIGSPQYRSIVEIIFPDIEFMSFDNVKLLPLFCDNFQEISLDLKRPSKVYAILPKDDLLVKNLNILTSNLFFTSINESCHTHVSKQMYFMDNIPLDFDKHVGDLLVSAMPTDLKVENKIILHPGTGSPAKILKDEFWLKLYGAIKQLDVEVILGLNDDIPKWLENINFTLIKDLKELTIKLKSAKYYFGLDSGVSHLAGLLGSKGAAIFVKPNVNYWSPLGSLDSVQVDFFEIRRWVNEI